jgi:aryl-alcohol dehydrogenase-like predicted oxidoreductase
LHGRSPAQIAISWLLKQPAVSTVIIGAKRIDQLRENVQAIEIALDEEDMAQFDAASRLPIEYPGWSLRGFSDRGL